MQSVTIAVSALTGGLTGACVNIFYNWLHKPKLIVRFQQGVRGCVVKTNFLGGEEDTQHYLRLKISNSGRSTAMKVSACVVSIIFKASDEGSWKFDEEVLDLKVAMTRCKIEFRLAVGAHQYVDVSHVTHTEPVDPMLDFDFVTTPARLLKKHRGAGSYRAKVFVSGDNCESESKEISWTWDGRFEGLNIESSDAPRKGWAHRVSSTAQWIRSRWCSAVAD